MALNLGMAEADFSRIEGAAGQQWHATLAFAHSDFQTLRHPYKNLWRQLVTQRVGCVQAHHVISFNIQATLVIHGLQSCSEFSALI